MINGVGNSTVTPIDVFVRIKRKMTNMGHDTQKMLAAQKLTEMGIDPNSTRIHVTAKIPEVDKLIGNEIILKPGLGGLQQVSVSLKV